MEKIKELKAMAYDCLAAIERNQNELRMINQQIMELIKEEENK